jgi:hypothetical protein
MPNVFFSPKMLDVTERLKMLLNVESYEGEQNFPSEPEDGAFAHDQSDNLVKRWNGTKWVPVLTRRDFIFAPGQKP